MCQPLFWALRIKKDHGQDSCFTGAYLLLKDTDRDIENRLVFAKGEGFAGGMEWEVGVSRCKLLYIEWVKNKVLLCSTGKYIQYPVINHNGKEYKKSLYVYN